MFDRKKYKEFAKTQLKGRWIIPIIMVIFTTFITLLLESPTLYSSLSLTDILLNETDPYVIMSMISETLKSPGATILSYIEMIISCVLDMAMIAVYIKMSHSPDPVKFADFIEGFSHWLKALLIFLWQYLWVFLWSLLFIIPGFIKAYSYSQMYYLACEYPNVKVRKLMKISMTITKGHKWDLFVLDLSFIGWALLTGLTCGILGLWFIPYYNMTKVNAYHAIMKEAIDRGIISKEDVQ